MLVSGYSGEMLGLISLTTTGFSGVIEDGLMAHEALTVEMSLPEGYFEHARLRNFLALDWGLILLAVLIVLCVLYWICTLRSRHPVVQPRVLPPEGWTPGELAAILGTEPNMAAQVLQWGQLGYLYVDHAGGELVLGLGMAMGSERPAHETRMFAHIFSGRREFWMPDRAFQQATAQASQAASRIWRARMFDRRGGNPHLLRIVSAIAAGMATAAAVAALLPVGAGWTILAFLTFIPGTALGLLAQLAVGELRRHPSPRWQLLPGLAALALLLMMGSARVLYAVPALLLQIFVGWQLAYGGRRSAAGVEALGQFLSLRRFLLQASPKRLQQMLQRDPTWLQSILPYAAQMGLLERLSRTLGSTRVEEPVWLRTDEPLTTASACCNAYKQLLRGLTKEK